MGRLTEVLIVGVMTGASSATQAESKRLVTYGR